MTPQEGRIEGDLGTMGGSNLRLLQPEMGATEEPQDVSATTPTLPDGLAEAEQALFGPSSEIIDQPPDRQVINIPGQARQRHLQPRRKRDLAAAEQALLGDPRGADAP